jgi:hypothetical protein
VKEGVAEPGARSRCSMHALGQSRPASRPPRPESVLPSLAVTTPVSTAASATARPPSLPPVDVTITSPPLPPAASPPVPPAPPVYGAWPYMGAPYAGMPIVVVSQADAPNVAVASRTSAARLIPLGGSQVGAAATTPVTSAPQNGHVVSVSRTCRLHSPHATSIQRGCSRAPRGAIDARIPRFFSGPTGDRTRDLRIKNPQL